MCYDCFMDIEQLNALLESIKNPSEDGVPETVYDDITAGFNSTIAGHGDSMAEANAKISSLETALAAKENELNDYKLRTFDRLMNSPVSDDGEPDDEPTEITIDDIYED